MQQSDPTNDDKPQSRGRASRAKLLGWLVHLLVIIACIIPGAWVNINAVLAQGGSNADVACVAGFAIAASVLTFFLMESLWQRRYGWAVGIAPLAVFFLVLNWGIAMGGFSVVHEAMRETRIAQIQQKDEDSEQARENKAKIDALRKTAGFDTPEMIAAEIGKLKKDRRFQSSGGCAVDGEKKITVKASETLCQDIDTLTGKLSAAKQIVKLEDERRARGWVVGTYTEHKSALSSDPTIDNLTQLVMTLFNLSVSPKLMGAIVASLKALGVELLADVVPPIIVMLFRMLKSAPEPARMTNPAPRMRRPVLPVLAPQDAPRIEARPGLHPAQDSLPHPAQDEPQDEARIALENKAHPAHPAAPVLVAESPQDETAILPQDEAPILARTAPAILPEKKDISMPQDGLDPADLEDVKSWREDCLAADQTGARTLYGDAFDHYSGWCKARGKKPVMKGAFTLAMKALGWPEMEMKAATASGAVNFRAKVGGKMWFYGAAIRKQAALKVVR
jgi:hypothetical protein